jgi:hypothetical protein
MGYMAHDAVIVTISDFGERPDVAAFRQEMPKGFQQLVVGPIPSVTNGYSTYVFAPDGSKEGWGDSDIGDEWRQRFVALFSDGFADVVTVRWGGDFGQEVGVRASDPHEDEGN